MAIVRQEHFSLTAMPIQSECVQKALALSNQQFKRLFGIKSESKKVAVHGFWKMENFQSPKMPKLLILSADLKF